MRSSQKKKNDKGRSEGRKTNRQERERWREAEKSVGGEETERFGDKRRMTKTERESKQENASVCVCAQDRASVLSYVHRRSWMSYCPIKSDTGCPLQLSVKTQSPRQHLSSDTPGHSDPSPPLELPSPIKLNECRTPFHDTRFSLRGHIVSGSKE